MSTADMDTDGQYVLDTNTQTNILVEKKSKNMERIVKYLSNSKLLNNISLPCLYMQQHHYTGPYSPDLSHFTEGELSMRNSNLPHKSISLFVHLQG